MSFATVDRDGREIIDAQEFIKGNISCKSILHCSILLTIKFDSIYKIIFKDHI